MAENRVLKRVVLKLSGESFAPSGERGISMDEVHLISRQIIKATESGCQIAIVIGGGNILRGAQFKSKNTSISEATAHYMGMLATVINGLAIQDALESLGCETRLMSAIHMDTVCEPYIRRRARHHLSKNRVIILAAGTGGPFVTTDTAAALRSLELGADALLKATRVDGVYSDDPELNPHAVFYRELNYETVLGKELAFYGHNGGRACMEHKMPIMIFNYQKEGNIQKAISGEKIGTIVTSKSETTS